MTFLRKIFTTSATLLFLLWFLISMARVVKHGLLTVTEPSLYLEPHNPGPDFNYYKTRFYLYPTKVAR